MTASTTSPESTAPKVPSKLVKRHKTPTVIQMEAVECGAAALAIILGYYGLRVPLEELRQQCGVSRDGSKASNVVKAARKYGMTAKGFQAPDMEKLLTYNFPMIIFWNFNHFLVLEGVGKDKVYLNDPAAGPRTVTHEEFDQSFTGVVLVFEPGPEFKKGGERKDFFGALLRRLEGSRSAVTFVLLTSLALMITGLVIPTFSRIFVDNILVQGQPWIGPLLLGMGATAIMRGVFTWLQQHFLLRFQTKLAITSSSKFFWHILRLPIEFFTQRYSGDIAGRVAINDKVAKLLTEDLATALLNVAVIIFYLILMVQYDWLLTLLGVFIAALNLVAFRFIARRRRDANERLQQENSKAQGVVFNGLATIETLKASGTESDFFTGWAGFQAKALDAEQEMGVSTQTLTMIPTLLTSITTAAILVIGGLRVMDGFMTIGMLVAFQSLMASFLGPVNQLVALGGTLQEVEVDMNRLDDVFRYRIDPQTKETDVNSISDAQVKLSGYLELSGINFGYSKLDAPLITDFSLKMKPGERIALVGGSGSGKSTVAKLVSGLFEPWSGDVLFDSVARTNTPRLIINNSVAMVDQDIFLFEGTIRDNLTLWDSTISEVDIIQAAKDAGIHADISARPGGYDSHVEEGGRNFSGGQRQRLEIARALVGKPTVLVLDEATSALDPIVEKTIADNLRRRGCTCLIIAHRLSTIRDSDEIIVLERGKVKERGTHDQLFAAKGYYHSLISTESYEKDKSQLQSILDRL